MVGSERSMFLFPFSTLASWMVRGIAAEKAGVRSVKIATRARSMLDVAVGKSILRYEEVNECR